MKAEVGDQLMVQQVDGGSPRVGTILAIKEIEGSPAYLVHWTAGDYTSLVFRRPGMRFRPGHTGPEESRSGSPVAATGVRRAPQNGAVS